MANYFSHDSNARNDEKLIRLRMRHKAAGYGVYFMILERLREESNYMSVKDYNMIAFDLREDAALIKSVVEDFGLFEFTEIDGKKFFYSESFLNRMSQKDELSRKRSEAGKASAAKRQQVLNNCSQESQQVLNNCQDSIKERKEPKEIKESKEKQSKVNIALTRDEEFLMRFLSNQGELETMLMKYHIDRKALDAMTQEILNEWKLTEQLHLNYSEFARHLMNTIRIKVKEESNGVNPKQAELKQAASIRQKDSEDLMKRLDEIRMNSVSYQDAKNSEEYRRALAEA